MDFIHYPRIDACGMAEADHMKEFEDQDGRFPLSLFRADDRKEWISLPIPSIGTPPELQDTQQWKVGVLLCM